jgi:hypothetical protein
LGIRLILRSGHGSDELLAKPACCDEVAACFNETLNYIFFPTAFGKWGDYQVVAEIAGAENISQSYISRVWRMTLLVPDSVEAIVAGRQPEGLTMARAMQPFPVEWESRTEMFAV